MVLRLPCLRCDTDSLCSADAPPVKRLEEHVIHAGCRGNRVRLPYILIMSAAAATAYSALPAILGRYNGMHTDEASGREATVSQRQADPDQRAVCGCDRRDRGLPIIGK